MTKTEAMDDENRSITQLMAYKLRYTAPLLLFLVLTSFFWKGLQLNRAELPSQLIDKPFPNFNLASLNAPTTRIDQTILQNKISLVNVWATWCISCAHEHPLLLDIEQTPGLQIIGLNFKDDLPTARSWLQHQGDPYSVILIDQDGKTAIDWGVYGTPETFLVDKRGIVRYRHVGPITLDSWHSILLPLISKLDR